MLTELQEQIKRNAQQLREVAYKFGRLDASKGNLCLPELYFVNADQKRAYARGHVSVTGPTLLSNQILGDK